MSVAALLYQPVGSKAILGSFCMVVTGFDRKKPTFFRFFAKHCFSAFESAKALKFTLSKNPSIAAGEPVQSGLSIAKKRQQVLRQYCHFTIVIDAYRYRSTSACLDVAPVFFG